ncbi:putative tRNA sulfurtransferase [Orchesella cincta]|uniref:Putative tRNA sulfurtransferase n=1 Tax=Orchesella cincta TaxID=48709 RepID=A0A1D2MM89_ORCCI|nr:putative tRNA sulfurtransferase [Orchesella cincta]
MIINPQTVHDAMGNNIAGVLSNSPISTGLNDKGEYHIDLGGGDLVPIVGLMFLVFICLVAFVWGANSARRQRDASYTLRNDRNHNRYRTFT